MVKKEHKKAKFLVLSEFGSNKSHQQYLIDQIRSLNVKTMDGRKKAVVSGPSFKLGDHFFSSIKKSILRADIVMIDLTSYKKGLEINYNTTLELGFVYGIMSVYEKIKTPFKLALIPIIEKSQFKKMEKLISNILGIQILFYTKKDLFSELDKEKIKSKISSVYREKNKRGEP